MGEWESHCVCASVMHVGFVYIQHSTSVASHFKFPLHIKFTLAEDLFTARCSSVGGRKRISPMRIKIEASKPLLIHALCFTASQSRGWHWHSVEGWCHVYSHRDCWTVNGQPGLAGESIVSPPNPAVSDAGLDTNAFGLYCDMSQWYFPSVVSAVCTA